MISSAILCLFFSLLLHLYLEPERGDCPTGKVFFSCRGHGRLGPSGVGVACELTCRNLMLNLTCPPMTPCVPGCGCPAGYLHSYSHEQMSCKACVSIDTGGCNLIRVFDWCRLVAHNGECYYPENCPCAWLGLEYLPGESVDTPCYRWSVCTIMWS